MRVGPIVGRRLREIVVVGMLEHGSIASGARRVRRRSRAAVARVRSISLLQDPNSPHPGAVMVGSGSPSRLDITHNNSLNRNE